MLPNLLNSCFQAATPPSQRATFSPAPSASATAEAAAAATPGHPEGKGFSSVMVPINVIDGHGSLEMVPQRFPQHVQSGRRLSVDQKQEMLTRVAALKRQLASTLVNVKGVICFCFSLCINGQFRVCVFRTFLNELRMRSTGVPVESAASPGSIGP